MERHQKTAHREKSPRRSDSRRPGPVIAIWVIAGLSALLPFLLWISYKVKNVVYDSSVSLPTDMFPTYLNWLLGSSIFFFICWILLFLGTKAGYYIWALIFILDALTKLRSLQLPALLFSALCLYLHFCMESRIYYRVGQFKTLPPRKGQRT